MTSSALRVLIMRAGRMPARSARWQPLPSQSSCPGAWASVSMAKQPCQVGRLLAGGGLRDDFGRDRAYRREVLQRSPAYPALALGIREIPDHPRPHAGTRAPGTSAHQPALSVVTSVHCGYAPGGRRD